MKFLASASSEADRRATRRSKPPPGSSRARGSESLSMLREVGHPRSSSHSQFLRLALGVHAELVSLVKAFVDATAGFIGASRHHATPESSNADCIKTRSSRLVQVGVDDAGEVESSSSARRGGQVIALDVNIARERGLLGSSSRVQTRTPVANDQTKRYLGTRYYWLQLSQLLRGSSGARPTSPACSARTSRAPAAPAGTAARAATSLGAGRCRETPRARARSGKRGARSRVGNRDSGGAGGARARACACCARLGVEPSRSEP